MSDNEDALNYALLKKNPHSQRLLCYFLYKEILERKAKQMGLGKTTLKEKTETLIYKL